MNINRATKQQIKELVNAMPALSQTAKRAAAICNARTVDARYLYKIISLDPILFCRVQSLFNYFHPESKNEFHGIAGIIIILNINTIKNYLLYLAAQLDALSEPDKKKNSSPEDERSFFLHAVSAGIAARYIAVKLGIDESYYELYYAAGLLHDIGKYFNIEDADHCAAGSIAAKVLGLAPPLNDAISYHHNTAKYRGHHKKLVCAAALADFIVHNNLTKQGNPSKTILDKTVWTTLGITEDFCGAAAAEVRIQIKKIESFIKAGS